MLIPIYINKGQSMLIKLLFILVFLSKNSLAVDFNNKGLVCQLDDSKEDTVYEIYLFKKSTFTSFYFLYKNNNILIKKTKAEKYMIDESNLILRGIKINKKKLNYNVMGGDYYCKLHTEISLMQELENIKKRKLDIKNN